MTDRSTALVVGASRGLGLALVQEWLERGWRVIATARGRSDPLEALANRFPGSLAIETVDINDAGTVRALRERLSGRRIAGTRMKPAGGGRRGRCRVADGVRRYIAPIRYGSKYSRIPNPGRRNF